MSQILFKHQGETVIIAFRVYCKHANAGVQEERRRAKLLCICMNMRSS